MAEVDPEPGGGPAPAARRLRFIEVLRIVDHSQDDETLERDEQAPPADQ
jgi:hypothetical protein